MNDSGNRFFAALTAAVGAAFAAVAWWATGEIAVVAAVAVAAAAIVYAIEANPHIKPPELPAAEPAIRADAVSIESLADPALLIDRASAITAANAAARKLVGERAVGEGLAVLLRHPAALDAVRLAREHDTPIEREIAGLGRGEGLYRLRVTGIGNDRLLLLFSDISAARLAERMRVDFVANASHELRTPLATIMGFIETLQGPASEDGPARKRFLEIMAREAGRMTRLIDDLLSLSRIELDKYVRPTTPVGLQPLLADVGKTLAMRLDADQRKLTIDADDELPRVIGDRDQILQVLHNLVSNALKYGRTGTPITLRAERIDRPQPIIRVSVIDQGDGIALEHLPRLTERFYRVDNSRSRSLGGTGLGLAIVKHIVERHRGELGIDSQEGIGTTVSFTLPQAENGAMSHN
ncbi:sensor histidine kinase [Sphingoaurantiacus capsulatus]|uniref:histidine kinase n=1 Tax=Sphingoaurantiacus capsulatus TaxID=1771310 RepID=A0ABV7XAE4_9SPHN